MITAQFICYLSVMTSTKYALLKLDIKNRKERIFHV